MQLEFIDLNSPPVNCDNRKATGKKNDTERSLKNQQRTDNIEFRKKKMTEWKTNFKSRNS